MSQILTASQQHDMGTFSLWISSLCICRVGERVKNNENWGRGGQKHWDNMWKPMGFENLTLQTHTTQIFPVSPRSRHDLDTTVGAGPEKLGALHGDKEIRTHGFAHLQRLGWKCKSSNKLSSRRNGPGHHNKQQEIQVRIHSRIVLPDSSDKDGIGRGVEGAHGEGGAGRMRLKWS